MKIEDLEQSNPKLYYGIMWLKAMKNGDETLAQAYKKVSIECGSNEQSFHNGEAKKE